MDIANIMVFILFKTVSGLIVTPAFQGFNTQLPGSVSLVSTILDESGISGRTSPG
jgi:hypothetical protein